MGSCLWKIESEFRTYGFLSLLDQIGPKRVIKPQASRWRHILVLYKLIGFLLEFWLKWGLFVKIGAKDLDFWLDKTFGPKWPKSNF